MCGPDELVRAFLAERDEPCPGCGYNLRGIGGATCPECNTQINLHVSPAPIPAVAIRLAVILHFALVVFDGWSLALKARLAWDSVFGSGFADSTIITVLFLKSATFVALAGGAIVCGGWRWRHGPAGSASRLLVTWALALGTASLVIHAFWNLVMVGWLI